MWPVIQRELRAEARNLNNWRLRCGSAALALLALCFYSLIPNVGGAQLGRYIFAGLHGMMFKVIWVFVPLMTADCISREVREGTLGLLFLTPLRAHGIMLGKSCVQAVRAATVWWAGLPVLAVPLVMGGVSAGDFILAAIVQAGSIAMALAVGLLASSYCRRREVAMAVAAAGAFACVALMGFAIGQSQYIFVTGQYEPGGISTMLSGLGILSGGWMNSTGNLLIPGMAVSVRGGFKGIVPGSVALAFQHRMILLALAGGALLVLVYLQAANRLGQAWRDRVMTAREQARRKFWLTPRVALSWFRKRQNRLLDGNPIRWLQQYSVNDRLLKWGLCLAVMVWESKLLGEYGDYGSHYTFFTTQFWLGALITAMLAFSAAGSFRRERENGALELILVTPVREDQLLFGRLIGIWQQFVPALVPLVLVWLFWWERGLEGYVMVLAIDLVALPLIGFYFSLKYQNFFTAWILTLLVRVLVVHVPTYGLYLLLNALGGGFYGFEFAALAVFGRFLELVCGAVAGYRLWQNLAQRRFLHQRNTD